MKLLYRVALRDTSLAEASVHAHEERATEGRRLNHSKEIRIYDAGGAADLLCPRCGADNLHHVGVVFYERGEDGTEVLQLTQTLRRYGEDRATGVVTEIVPSDRARNPSARRSGMAVQFECEQCGGGTDEDRIELTIAQHKGSTEIGWRFTPKANSR